MISGGAGPRPTLPPVPVRALLWRRVASLAYEAPPPYAHELYGRPVPSPAAVDRRLRAAGRVPRAVPPTGRRQLPPKHLLRAVAGLGPGTRPSAYKLCRPAAILRAHGAQGEPQE